MTEYISRKEALVAIKNLYPGVPLVKINLPKWHENNKAYMECELAIEAIPAADVAPVRRGRWLRTPTWWIYCSECGCEPPNECNAKTPYCPNCGARMEVTE